jgi:hypothetical protein
VIEDPPDCRHVFGSGVSSQCDQDVKVPMLIGELEPMHRAHVGSMLWLETVQNPLSVSSGVGSKFSGRG